MLAIMEKDLLPIWVTFATAEYIFHKEAYILQEWSKISSGLRKFQSYRIQFTKNYDNLKN